MVNILHTKDPMLVTIALVITIILSLIHEKKTQNPID